MIVDVADTHDELVEIYEMCKREFQAEWQICADQPPYPTVTMLEEYLAGGCTILVTRPAAGEPIDGYSVYSASSGRPLWVYTVVGEEHRDDEMLNPKVVEQIAQLTTKHYQLTGKNIWQQVDPASLVAPTDDVTNPKVTATRPFIYRRYVELSGHNPLNISYT